MKARYDAMYETYVLAVQVLRPLGIIEIGR